MGKNIEIRKPNSPMSGRQSYMMFLTTGVDVRETELTKGMASAIIDNIVNGKCYHARLTCAGLDGSEVKRQDVHKSHRKDKKPKGYALAMAAIGEDEEEETPAPAPKAKKKQPTRRAKKAQVARKAEETPKRQTKAEKLGLDAVDLDDPRVQAMLKAFATT